MKKFNKYLQALGPGIITAALVFGPSKITVVTKIGAEYDFKLIWIVVITIYFMVLFTSMSARIGLASQKSLLDTIKEKWGKKVSFFIGIGIFLVCSSFQAGNSIGAGMALSELTGFNQTFWIVFVNLFAIGLLFFRSFYKILEKLMLILIGLMLLAFIITFALSNPPVAKITEGLIPQIPSGSFGLITAFVASCFSIAAAFYQAYLIQERKRIAPQDTVVKDKSLTGILILGLLSGIVMVCAATILHPQGIKVNSATDMGKALEPLFGKYASLLFLCGFFGASFSALVGNSSLGGTILGDVLGFGSRLTSKKVKMLIAIIMIIGASIAIIFGGLPIQLIVLAQTVTIFVVPVIGIAMFIVANDKAIMGNFANNRLQKIFGVLGLLLVIFLAVQSFITLFIK